MERVGVLMVQSADDVEIVTVVPMADPKPSGNASGGSKSATKSVAVNAAPSGHLKGMKWYWFCDEQGISWIPYKDEHQYLIQTAWEQNKSHVIVMERFKIEFDRSGTNATGKQHNFRIHDSWRRDVIRGVADGHNLINGIPCAKYPR